MTSIVDYMTDKHRECDDVFTEAESAAAHENWALADEKLRSFVAELYRHLDAEEQVLFPEFEQATGIVNGPTMVMRSEHEQMRATTEALKAALTKQDKDEYLGLSESLMVLMQQHNMKEEMMLYPMTEQRVPNADKLGDAVKARCEAS